MSMNEFFRTFEPATRGEWDAYRAWQQTTENNTDHFEVDELPWGVGLRNGEMDEMLQTLRRAGVARIAVTDRSTALMESLHALCGMGCTIIGPCTVNREPGRWGDKSRLGLEIKIAE
ncbi:MAG: hypothetical protein J6J78_08985 [Clostridia bacterium]|nr:hypothetical protein [Clostridia bacterium]